MNAFPDDEYDGGSDDGYLDALTQDFTPKVKPNLKINIQPKRTGKQILLMAFVNMGLKQYNTEKEKYEYKPVIVSTGLLFPFEGWDKKKKIAFGKYAYIMDKAEEFKKYAQLLYTNLLEDIKSSVHEQDPYLMFGSSNFLWENLEEIAETQKDLIAFVNAYPSMISTFTGPMSNYYETTNSGIAVNPRPTSGCSYSLNMNTGNSQSNYLSIR